MEKEFSIRESLKTSWKLIKGENLFLLIGLFLGYMVLIGLFQTVSIFVKGNTFIGLIISLLEIFVGMVFSLGFVRILLQIIDGDEPSFDSFGKVIRLIPRYIGASILRALPVLLPLIVVGVSAFLARDFFVSFKSLNPADANAVAEWLQNSNVPKLVVYQFLLAIFVASIPMIYLNVRWVFYAYLMVDKNLGAIASLRRSWELTSGNFWHLILYFIVTVILIILGVIAFIIGVLVVIPLISLAIVLIYRKLEESVEEEESEE